MAGPKKGEGSTGKSKLPAGSTATTAVDAASGGEQRPPRRSPRGHKTGSTSPPRTGRNAAPTSAQPQPPHGPLTRGSQSNSSAVTAGERKTMLLDPLAVKKADQQNEKRKRKAPVRRVQVKQSPPAARRHAPKSKFPAGSTATTPVDAESGGEQRPPRRSPRGHKTVPVPTSPQPPARPVTRSTSSKDKQKDDTEKRKTKLLGSLAVKKADEDNKKRERKPPVPRVQQPPPAERRRAPCEDCSRSPLHTERLCDRCYKRRSECLVCAASAGEQAPPRGHQTGSGSAPRRHLTRSTSSKDKQKDDTEKRKTGNKDRIAATPADTGSSSRGGRGGEDLCQDCTRPAERTARLCGLCYSNWGNCPHCPKRRERR